MKLRPNFRMRAGTGATARQQLTVARSAVRHEQKLRARADSTPARRAMTEAQRKRLRRQERNKALGATPVVAEHCRPYYVDLDQLVRDADPARDIIPQIPSWEPPT